MKIQTLNTPDYILKGLSENYLAMIGESEQKLAKDPDKFFVELQAAFESTSEEIKALPAPIRLKHIGVVPIQLELNIHEDATAISALFELLISENVAMTQFVDVLIQISEPFREYIKMVAASTSDMNLGNVNTCVYPHRYFVRGERFFEITPALIEMLEKTDLGGKTPSGFLRAPYDMQYIHCPASLKLLNRESGWHDLEGMYINQYVLVGDTLREEYEYCKRKKITSTFTYFVETGYINLDGGDVRALEIMSYGKPKATIFDDATYNFTILLQDDTKTVDEVVVAHKKYYTEKPETRPDLYDYVPMDDDNAKVFSEVMEIVTKVLLYINSDKAERREMKDATDMQKRIDGMKNPSKIKKLKKQKRRLVDKIVIGSDSYDFGDGHGTGKSRSVKTHWRRGHFAKRWHGEGRKDLKVVWIQPTIIGSGKLKSGATYKVK